VARGGGVMPAAALLEGEWRERECALAKVFKLEWGETTPFQLTCNSAPWNSAFVVETFLKQNELAVIHIERHAVVWLFVPSKGPVRRRGQSSEYGQKDAQITDYIPFFFFRWWRHWAADVTWCDVISNMTLHWDKLSPGEFQQLQDFAACKCHLFWVHFISAFTVATRPPDSPSRVTGSDRHGRNRMAHN
jgi:hypothetical protein